VLLHVVWAPHEPFSLSTLRLLCTPPRTHDASVALPLSFVPGDAAKPGVGVCERDATLEGRVGGDRCPRQENAGSEAAGGEANAAGHAVLAGGVFLRVVLATAWKPLSLLDLT